MVVVVVVVVVVCVWGEEYGSVDSALKNGYIMQFRRSENSLGLVSHVHFFSIFSIEFK